MVQIVKITEWYWNYRKQDPMVMPDEVLWGMGSGKRGERHYFYVIEESSSPATVERIKSQEGYDGPDHEFTLVGDEDRWVVVPPSKWPDHVCAAVAKRALMGEDHD